MSKTFEEALALLIQQKQNLNYIPEIIETDWEDGHDFEYSEYTRDHAEAMFIVKYKNPLPTHNKIFTYEFIIEHYSGGFAGLVKDIVALMN